MGTPSNSDGWPDNGGPHGELPGLPPEWGSIVIPDDPAELAAEAALVRRELRRQGRRAAWRRRLGLAPAPGRPPTAPLRVPLLIMAIAIVATLSSLFAVVWPTPQRQPVAPRTNPSGAAGRTLPGLDLGAEDGSLVPLHSLLPAVIILIDDCACPDQVAAAVRVVPTGVRVITVLSRGSTPGAGPAATPGTGGSSGTGGGPLPSGSPSTAGVRALTDPAARLHDFLHLPAQPGLAAALFAARTGEIVRTLPSAGNVPDYPAELSQLATR